MSLKKWGSVYLVGIMGILLVSCINSKSITYFNNLPDSLKTDLKSIEIPPQKIQVNDLLAVKVGGDNEKTVAYINQPMLTWRTTLALVQRIVTPSL